MAYAKSLLRLGEGATDSPTLATSLPWMSKDWPLEDRVSESLNPNRRTETRVGRGIAFVSLIALVAVVIGAAGIAISEKTQAQQAPTSTKQEQDRASS
jgi:predicted lysophospholipase L1 biosynthesis ABC-type transport system permease subunit